MFGEMPGTSVDSITNVPAHANPLLHAHRPASLGAEFAGQEGAVVAARIRCVSCRHVEQSLGLLVAG